MKEKWFTTADNTVLNCPEVDYKYNLDTYKMGKRGILIFALFVLVALFIAMEHTDSPVFQTIFGAFMGGSLSLLVWLITIWQQDKMNYEVANIDYHIMAIDEHLDFIHSKVQFIDPDKYDMVEADSRNLAYRFVHLLLLVGSLSSDKAIDTSNLRLKFSDENEYNLQEYVEKCDELCNKGLANIIILQEKWEEIISWNYYTIDRHLNEIKKKLFRYKIYILRGNAPMNISNKNRLI